METLISLGWLVMGFSSLFLVLFVLGMLLAMKSDED